PLARAVLIEIVEPGLADPDNLGMAGKLDQPGRAGIGLALRLMGMDADRAPDIPKAFGDRQHPFEFREPRTDGDESPHPSIPRAGDDGVELAGESLEIEMAMAVDEHAAIAWLLRPPSSRRSAERPRSAPARQCRRRAPGPGT